MAERCRAASVYFEVLVPPLFMGLHQSAFSRGSGSEGPRREGVDPRGMAVDCASVYSSINPRMKLSVNLCPPSPLLQG